MNMNITVNKDDSMPLYRQIVRQFRDQILSGHMQPGFRLPPERELAAMLEVTRTTVKTAYDELKSQGLVDARVGRGTVVLAGQQTYPDVRASRTVVWSQYFNDQRLQPADH